jgi:serine/threonine protein phosphatase PrpC
MYSNWLRNDLKFGLTHVMEQVMNDLLPECPEVRVHESFEPFDQYMREKISFIENYLLSTFIFFLIRNDIVFVGHCGDGIIVLNNHLGLGNIVNCIDERGSPDYIAYRLVPSNILKDSSKQIEIKVDVHCAAEIDKLVIATDGLQPLVDSLELDQLYDTQKRQLQRKFNIWQNDKKFGDDTSCIVVEKQPQLQMTN